jgi:hypothetical protein
VADLRIALEEDAGELAPRTAELLMRSALGDVTMEQALSIIEDPEAEVHALLLVPGRLRDEGVTERDGLDAFLREARHYAQQAVQNQRATADGTVKL